MVSLAVRQLGKSGIAVSAIGFGAMGLSDFYSSLPDTERPRAIHRALECGITHFDTADMYGAGENETLLGRELLHMRGRVSVATKCGLVRGRERLCVNGTPAHIRAACTASLQRLRMECVDLLYLHRVDPAVPIEESVGAMADLVREGKVRYLGLSKIDAATLLRAESVHSVTAVQMQYSIVSRDAERELLELCRLRDIALVVYSPLCKGLLAGCLSRFETLSEHDWRRRDVRFQDDAIARNEYMIRIMREHADANGCTIAQLALAWLLSRGEHVIPIPGMRSPAQVDEDIGALQVALAPATLNALESWTATPRC
jgi:aryl-alcohol dehydrogenase-like predicted oxidoreductase